MNRQRHVRWTSLLLPVLLLAGCDGGTTPESDAADDAGDLGEDVVDADADDDAGESVIDVPGDAPDDGDGAEAADAPDDAARDTPDDGAREADVADVPELSCSEVLACIEACAVDITCVMGCYGRICDHHAPFIEAIMACATDLCETQCADPTAPECLACVYEDCADEVADCSSATECWS